MKKDGRAIRHNQVQTMIGQMRASRKMAHVASIASSECSGNESIGLILTSNSMLGFGLELGLKSFYMTYFHKKPQNTHNLFELYDNLPPSIKFDIDTNYVANLDKNSTFVFIALITSPTQPEKPSDMPNGKIDTAESFFKTVSNIFVHNRYFFENINREDWSIISHPINQASLMIDVLDKTYQHYLEVGGFGRD